MNEASFKQLGSSVRITSQALLLFSSSPHHGELGFEYSIQYSQTLL
jgi:hypothetical protein